METTMSESNIAKANTATARQLCRRCGFHPASPRIAEYCSWDCYDADDEDDEEDEKAA